MNKRAFDTTDYRRKSIKYIHWSPKSQPIAKAEILVNRLERGWIPAAIVQEEIQRSGQHTLKVYHFTLTCNDEVMAIPVYNSPVVRRIILERNLQVMPYEAAV